MKTVTAMGVCHGFTREDGNNKGPFDNKDSSWFFKYGYVSPMIPMQDRTENNSNLQQSIWALLGRGLLG